MIKWIDLYYWVMGIVSLFLGLIGTGIMNLIIGIKLPESKEGSLLFIFGVVLIVNAVFHLYRHIKPEPPDEQG